jgi:hypothetical protein
MRLRPVLAVAAAAACASFINSGLDHADHADQLLNHPFHTSNDPSISAAAAESARDLGGNATLVSAVVICRHGARTPALPLTPDDCQTPWLCSSFSRSFQRPSDVQLLQHHSAAPPLPHGSCGRGELTQAGVLQMLRLGQAFRLRYVPAPASAVLL